MRCDSLFDLGMGGLTSENQIRSLGKTVVFIRDFCKPEQFRPERDQMVRGGLQTEKVPCEPSRLADFSHGGHVNESGMFPAL